MERFCPFVNRTDPEGQVHPSVGSEILPSMLLLSTMIAALTALGAYLSLLVFSLFLLCHGENIASHRSSQCSNPEVNHFYLSEIKVQSGRGSKRNFSF